MQRSSPANCVSFCNAAKEVFNEQKNIFWRCCHQRFDPFHLLGVADSVAKTSHFDILDATLHLTASVCSHYSSKRVSTHLELDGFLASSVLVNLVRISIENLHSVFKSPVYPTDPLCTLPAHPTLHRRLVCCLARCLRTVEPHAWWCQNSSTTSGEERGENMPRMTNALGRTTKTKLQCPTSKTDRRKEWASIQSSMLVPHNGTPWEARCAKYRIWTLKVRVVGHLASPGVRTTWR